MSQLQRTIQAVPPPTIPVKREFQLRVISEKKTFTEQGGELIGSHKMTEYFPFDATHRKESLVLAAQSTARKRANGTWEEILTRSDVVPKPLVQLEYNRGSQYLSPFWSHTRRGCLDSPEGSEPGDYAPGEYWAERCDALVRMGYLTHDPGDLIDPSHQFINGSGQVEPAYIPPKRARKGVEELDQPTVSILDRRKRKDAGHKRGPNRRSKKA